MPDLRLSIRLDLDDGRRIGPGKIALLEAIRDNGSISAGARHIGMSYRRAWLLVEELNQILRAPAITTTLGGNRRGGATLTDVGAQVIAAYRGIEAVARRSASAQCRAIDRLARK